MYINILLYFYIYRIFHYIMCNTYTGAASRKFRNDKYQIENDKMYDVEDAIHLWTRRTGLQDCGMSRHIEIISKE